MKKTKINKTLKTTITTFIILLLVSSTVYAQVTNKPTLKPVLKITEEIEQTNNIIELKGTINVDLEKEGVYPSINLLDSQVLNFGANIIDEGFIINKTIRVNIKVFKNATVLLDKYLTTLIFFQRKDCSLFPLRSLISRLFVGKILNINITNVVKSGNRYIDIPLNYETSSYREEINMHIFALGQPVLKVLSKTDKPILIHKKIKLDFVYANTDFIPPISSHIISGEMNESGIYTNNVTIELEAFDEESGVDFIKFSYKYDDRLGHIIQIPWTNYEKPIVLSKKGDYTFGYYSVDQASNQEQIKNFSFTIWDSYPADNIPPITNHELIGSMFNNTYITNVTMILNATDDSSGIYDTLYCYTFWKGDVYSHMSWKSYKEPVIFSMEGNYSVGYYSIDNAGNEEESKTVEFEIKKIKDITPPVTIPKLVGETLD